MKKLLFSFMLIPVFWGSTFAQSASKNRAAETICELHDPHSRNVLVVAHRGDWRNYPENSIPAIESAISMGVDIVEIDLALTADSVLVVCHDRTIDRTTNGRGLVSDITLDSIRRCNLKTGHGVTTRHRMPTLREMLKTCRDRVVVNIDKGYQYYELVQAVSEELGMTEQLLIKGTNPVKDVAAMFAKYEHNMMYMPIIDMRKLRGRMLFDEYMSQRAVPLAYEVCWSELTPKVKATMKRVAESGSKLWTNSLWASLCGALDDDAALERGPEAIYGKHIELGATIIQTDRPELLISYLREQGLHK
ncbi:glycerophosphodiester phosphodiesterase family protein [uncultured Alistipes sp.]|jgi:glycerophosphodiester phosphodiesterase|uniref:glycerophosphodiester phosphodiesterase family protein n=1 Tax=uncultured Alistipes sp. TaxID=538949 RepID=UPI0027D9663D|nr:glycerophosphodiester phosphodiesterase family protein [uncultured Alistipes sp.]